MVDRIEIPATQFSKFLNATTIKKSTNMPRFKKKPVVIEAMQFTDLNSYLEIVEWMKKSGNTQALAGEVKFSTPIMLIPTLEGMMTANSGDWIIRGIQNEFYPCKPDIFELTYELADS